MSVDRLPDSTPLEAPSSRQNAASVRARRDDALTSSFDESDESSDDDDQVHQRIRRTQDEVHD